MQNANLSKLENGEIICANCFRKSRQIKLINANDEKYCSKNQFGNVIRISLSFHSC